MRKQTTQRLAQPSGFSLIEAVVAVALAGVIGAVAAPMASSYVKQYRIIGAANQLAFEIARTRMQAVGQNVSLRVRFTGSSSYLRERSTDGGASWTQVEVTTTLPSGVYAQTSPPIAFNKNGVATIATSVMLSNGETTKTIRTNVLGRVTIS